MKEPAPRAPDELDLNREGAGVGASREAWANLGLWRAGDAYGMAARRLATRIGEGALLGPGKHLLDLGMGPAQQWSLWQERFGVASIVGLDPDPDHCAWAEGSRRGQDRIVCAPAERVGDHLAAASMDAVVAVDAAYHFPARCGLLAALARILRPGGRAAWSDLVLATPPPRPGPLLAAALPIAGIPAVNLMTSAHYVGTLEAAGWRDVELERLDAEVLDGFARWWPSYRRRHRVHPRLWLRAEVTARVLEANRRHRRLGYVVVAASPPAPRRD